jgi:nitronate monooxygenase
LGASGVWVGTRFVASEESLAHPIYKQKLLDATENETMYSTLFDIGWQNAPHRTLLNSTVIEGTTTAGKMQANSGKTKGEEVIAATADGHPIVRSMYRTKISQ